MRWNFGQSDKALQIFEGSGIGGSVYDRGIAVVKIVHPIPAGTYDIWYRVTETGREWQKGNLRYAWIEWPYKMARTKVDLTPFLSTSSHRKFGEWVKVGHQISLPELGSNELLCLSDDPQYDQHLLCQ